MSYVGGSISQAVAITGAEGRLSAVEAVAASKVASAVYDAKVALLDAKDAEHDSAIAAKVASAVYDAKVALLDAKDAQQDLVIATKLSSSVYDLKMIGLDAHDAAHDAAIAALEGRAGALETRAGAIESDISSRVDAAIAEKVAITTFDALASELRNADSALTTALATKVATVVQAAKDAEQDAKDAEHDAKDAALVEFVRAMLSTYTITKPDGSPYSWTGAVQGLSFGGGGYTPPSGGGGSPPPSGGGGSPPPSGDYPIVINSAGNGDINITSSAAYGQGYAGVVEIVNGVPDFNVVMGINGGPINVGTATFTSGFFFPWNAGKVIRIYAMPADKMPWDSYALYGVPVTAPFTL